MAFSTGISLLTVNPVVLPNLSYSTATLISRDPRLAIASPNPDGWGATDFPSSGSVGASISKSGDQITCTITGNYPSYLVTASISPLYMGSYTGTLTPQIRDSQGFVGTTSGAIPVSLSRSFTWGLSTGYNENTTDGITTLGIRCGSGSGDESFQKVRLVNNSVSSLNTPQPWNTLNSLASDAGIYNEVKFEDLSGSTDWVVTTAADWTTSRSKGVYYNILNSAIKVNPRTSAGVTTCGIRITMRNKNNTGNLFTQDITLQVTRT